jgi:opacity protein-like surface antigen
MRIFLIVAALYLMNAAVAAAAAQQTAAPAAATGASAAAGGDWRKTWKVGPDRYAFEGVSGGCHYSGTVSPSSYHLDRSC